jgi:hypothetical protein
MVLLAFALRWALLAVLSARLSDPPQHWAAAPAVFFALADLISLIGHGHRHRRQLAGQAAGRRTTGGAWHSRSMSTQRRHGSPCAPRWWIRAFRRRPLRCRKCRHPAHGARQGALDHPAVAPCPVVASVMAPPLLHTPYPRGYGSGVTTLEKERRHRQDELKLLRGAPAQT